MKKEDNKFQSQPLDFEKINLEEACTKLDNIILSYPFNPLKVEFNKIPWISRDNLPLQRPFCGLIEECHKEGFIIYSDWLNKIGSKRRGFYYFETQQIREKITIHLGNLINKLDFTKEKERIVVNNEFKELNTWLNKMYSKICKMDEQGGWDVTYLNQVERRDKIARAYKKYRINKEKRLKGKIQKYKIELENLDLPKPEIKPIRPYQNINTDIFSIKKMKLRKIPKNLSEYDRIKNKLERYEYNENDVKRNSDRDPPIRREFEKNFYIYHMHTTKENIYASEEFEKQINEVLRLIGKEWVSLINGKLMLLGTSVEEREEKLIFKQLQKYPRVLKTLEKAQKNIKDADWNDVPLYCCKSIERFYNILLKNKKKYEDKNLSLLTKIIRDKKEKIFKNSVRGVNDGLDYLILASLNLVGSIRNRRDSAHGNITDVPEWEAKMCYSFTLLLFGTLYKMKS